MTTVQIIGIAVASVAVLLLIIALLVTRRRGGQTRAETRTEARAETTSFLDEAPQDTFAGLGKPEQPVEDITLDPAVERARRAEKTASEAVPRAEPTAAPEAAAQPEPAAAPESPAEPGPATEPEPPGKTEPAAAPPQAARPPQTRGPVLDWGPGLGRRSVATPGPWEAAADEDERREAATEAAADATAVTPSAERSESPPPVHGPETAARLASPGAHAAHDEVPESDSGRRLVPLSDILVTTSTKTVDLGDPEVRRMLTELVTYEIDQAMELRHQGQTIDAVLQLTEAEKVSRALGMTESARGIQAMMDELRET